jgi:hypothetical protein
MTIAAYGSMMSFLYHLGNKYYPIPYDLKENRRLSRAIHIFSAVSLRFQRNYYVGIGLLIDSYILSITMKVTLIKIIKG